MAIMNGGAMEVVNAKTKSANMATGCIGFLDLVWHGAHDEGTGADRETYVRVPLADWTPGGQFEFYFCSTRCLRDFLNACIDQLENKIRKSKTARTPLRRAQKRTRK